MAFILIVDDDANMRTLVEEMTAVLGHESLSFDDGLKAQEYLQNPQRRLPEIVLSDMNMPGLDGEHLLAQLRADPDTRGIIAVLMSGKVAMRRAAEVQGIPFLGKPFTMNALKDIIAKCLEKAKQA